MTAPPQMPFSQMMGQEVISLINLISDLINLMLFVM